MTASVSIPDERQGGRIMGRCLRKLSLTLDESNVVHDMIKRHELPFRIVEEKTESVRLTHLNGGSSQEYYMFSLSLEYEDTDSGLLSMLIFFTKEIVKYENSKRA